MTKPSRRGKRPARKKRALSQETVEHRLNLKLGKYQRRWLEGLVPEDEWLNPLCGDPLGLLLITKLIDQDRYQNGMAFRDVARHYRRIHGLPSGYPKLLGVKGVSNGHYDPTIAESITKRYLASRKAINRRGGKDAMRAVHHICCSERMIAESQLGDLRKGLSVLAARPLSRAALLRLVDRTHQVMSA